MGKPHTDPRSMNCKFGLKPFLDKTGIPYRGQRCPTTVKRNSHPTYLLPVVTTLRKKRKKPTDYRSYVKLDEDDSSDTKLDTSKHDVNDVR